MAKQEKYWIIFNAHGKSLESSCFEKLNENKFCNVDKIGLFSTYKKAYNIKRKSLKYAIKNNYNNYWQVEKWTIRQAKVV